MPVYSMDELDETGRPKVINCPICQKEVTKSRLNRHMASAHPQYEKQ